MSVTEAAVLTSRDLSGRKVTRKNRGQELCESQGGLPGLLVPNSPYGLCGREATLDLNLSLIHISEPTRRA